MKKSNFKLLFNLLILFSMFSLFMNIIIETKKLPEYSENAVNTLKEIERFAKGKEKVGYINFNKDIKEINEKYNFVLFQYLSIPNVISENKPEDKIIATFNNVEHMKKFLKEFEQYRVYSLNNMFSLLQKINTEEK